MTSLHSDEEGQAPDLTTLGSEGDSHGEGHELGDHLREQPKSAGDR